MKKKGTTSTIFGRIFISKKNVYYITIMVRDVLKFYQLVWFTIRRKQQLLEEYLRRRGLLKEKPPNQFSPNYFSPKISTHSSHIKLSPSLAGARESS
jgi:hypothetical protein